MDQYTPEEIAFTRAVERAESKGPVALQLTVTQCVNLVAVLQLVSRHPHARYSQPIQQVIGWARQIHAYLEERDEELGRLLERGWHPVFDEPGGPPFREIDKEH